MDRSARSLMASLITALAVAGCALGDPTAAPRPTSAKRPSRLAPAPTGALPAAPAAGVAPGAGSIVANNTGSLIGKVKAPATLISDKGLGLVSDQGGSLVSDKGLGFRVLAVAQVPVAGVRVTLVNADGSPVEDADGRAITAVTDAEGSYAVDYQGNTSNLLIQAHLSDEKGDLVALLPKDAGAGKRTVDLDLTSTLVMRYVLQAYVKGDATILDKLPAEVEEQTREVMAKAVEATGFEPPEDLAPERVVSAVEALRHQDAGIDGQLEEVRKRLIAGLADQGNGLPADKFETDAYDVAVGADGTVYFGGLVTQRVWRKDAQGHIVAFAGSGMPPRSDVRLTPDQPAAGDGGPATEAVLLPLTLELLQDGRMLVLERVQRRVRLVDTNGVITTYAAHADWDEPRDLAVEADGSVLVATHAAVYRVAPDRTISLIAGAPRPYDPLSIVQAVASGDGGPPLEARFVGIQSLAVDSRSGAIYLYDLNGQVRRIADGTIAPFAGQPYVGASSPFGAFGGDGGPAEGAQLSRVGSVRVRGDGAVLIGDATNRRIRLVRNGVITTVAGNGTSGLASDGPALQQPMVEPRHMTVTPGGAVVFADGGFVRKLHDGTLTNLVGGLRHLGQKRPANEVQLLEASDIRYDAAANAMIIGDGRHLFRWTLDDDQIEAIASKGVTGRPFVEGAPALENDLIIFRGLMLEPDGSLTVAATSQSTFSTRILSLKDGVFTTLAGGAFGQKPSTDLPVREATIAGPDLAIARIDDTYYYTIRSSGRMRSFTPGGTTARFAGYGTATEDGAAAVDYAVGAATALAKGPDGHLYVGAVGQILRIDMATKQLTRYAGAGFGAATGDGGPALSAGMAFIEGFAFDAAGHMYLSDAFNNRVRRIDKDTGIITSVAGTGTSNYNGNTADTGLAVPRGLAFDGAGNLYIADYLHGQIKVVPANRL